MAIQRSSVDQRLQFGKEAVRGTAVPAYRRLPTLMMDVTGEVTTIPYRRQGSKFKRRQVIGKEWTSAKSSAGGGDYNELIFPLAGAYNAPANPTTVGTGFKWVFSPSSGAGDVPVTFSVEQGDDTRGLKFAGAVFTDWGFTLNRDEFATTAALFGGRYNKDSVVLTSPHIIQTLTLTGTPTGTFKLGYGGTPTATIAPTATAATVKTAIEAIPAIGAGNSTVVGGPLGTAPMTITLNASLAGTALAFTVDDALLVGTHTVTVVDGTLIPDSPMEPSTFDLFIDPTFAAAGTTKVTATNVAMNMTGRWGPNFKIDSSQLSYGGLVALVPTLTGSIMLEADSVGEGFVDYLRATQTVYLQVKSTGPLLPGDLTNHYSFKGTWPVQVTKPTGYKDDAGLYAVSFDLEAVDDDFAGNAGSIELVNAMSSF